MKHAVTEHKLKGGAKGLVVHVPEAPVISFEVTFNSGYQFSPPEKYELPHVAEHLMATCSRPSYPEHNSISIAIGENGAYANASTSPISNGYVFEFAAFELDRILGIFDEYLAHPIFTEAGLKSEIGNVREELSRNTTNYGRICSLALSEKAFPQMSLNDLARIEQLKNITLDDIKDFYPRTHVAGNARIYLAGDFADGGKHVMKQLEAIVAKLPAGDRFELNNDIGLDQSKPIWQNHDIKQLYYQMALYFDEIPVDLRPAAALFRTILVGGMPARIYGKARTRGLAYGVFGGISTGPGESVFGLHGYVTPDNAKDLFKLFSDEVVSLRGGDLGETELTAAKDRIIGGVTRTHQKASDMLDWYSGVYDSEERILDFDGYLDELRRVTPEQVIQVARQAVSLERHGVSFVGPVDEKLAGEYADLLKPIWSKRV